MVKLKVAMNSLNLKNDEDSSASSILKHTDPHITSNALVSCSSLKEEVDIKLSNAKSTLQKKENFLKDSLGSKNEKKFQNEQSKEYDKVRSPSVDDNKYHSILPIENEGVNENDGETEPGIIKKTQVEAMIEYLSDDSLICIMEYISSPSTLFNFLQTTQRFYNLINKKEGHYSHLEALLKRLFIHKWKGTPQKNWSWREEWERLYTLRKALSSLKFKSRTELIRGSSIPKNNRIRRTRLGILSRIEENSSMGYDGEPRYLNAMISIGYFGLHAFSYDPNFPSLQAVVVNGDFCGVRIYPSLSALLYKPVIQNKKADIQLSQQLESPIISSVGETKSQVLTILLNTPPSLSCEQRYNKKRPCFFLGFADGAVMAVIASTDPNFVTSYSTRSTAVECQHSNEVTTLCFLPESRSHVCCPSNRCSCSCFNKILASGSVDGTVLIFPHAICCGSLLNPILVLNNHDVGILSISCCDHLRNGVVLFTGDLHGYVTVWKSSGGYIAQVNDEKIVGQAQNKSIGGRQVEKYNFMPFMTLSKQEFSSASPQQHVINVTRVLFAMDEYVITGYNNGDIRFWKYEMEQLTLKHCFKKAHSGTVESMDIRGDILFSSGGGLDGIKTWYIPSGEYLGQIKDYDKKYGKNSAVVGFMMERRSIVFVKRNGILLEWDFYNHIIHNEAQKGSKKRSHNNRKNAEANMVKTEKPSTINDFKTEKRPREENTTWECRYCKSGNNFATLACSTCGNLPQRKTALAALASIKDNSRESEESNVVRKWECRRCNHRNDEHLKLCVNCGGESYRRKKIVLERMQEKQKKRRKTKRLSLDEHDEKEGLIDDNENEINIVKPDENDCIESRNFMSGTKSEDADEYDASCNYQRPVKEAKVSNSTHESDDDICITDMIKRMRKKNSETLIDLNSKAHGEDKHDSHDDNSIIRIIINDNNRIKIKIKTGATAKSAARPIINQKVGKKGTKNIRHNEHFVTETIVGPNQWQCTLCTIVNEVDHFICSMCFSPR